MSLRKLTIFLLFLFLSCQRSNRLSSNYELKVYDIRFNKLVEWDGLKSSYVIISIQCKNNSNDTIYISKDLSSTLVFSNEEKNQLLLKDLKEEKLFITPWDSLLIGMEIDKEFYAKNLSELISDNQNFIKSNYYIIFSNWLRDDIQKTDTIIKDKVLEVKAILDREEVSLKDSLKMNYGYEVPSLVPE